MSCKFKKLFLLIPIITLALCLGVGRAETNTNFLTSTVNKSNQPMNSGDSLTSVLRMLGAFVFVTAVFLAFAWMFKHKHSVFGAQNKKTALKIIEVKHIGGRQALIVAGYGKERILIGATPTNISFISKLPDEDEINGANEPQAQENNFFTLLRNTLKSR